MALHYHIFMKHFSILFTLLSAGALPACTSISGHKGNYVASTDGSIAISIDTPEGTAVHSAIAKQLANGGGRIAEFKKL